ncbi:Gp5.5-like host HNS inhibition [Enterobacter phage phiEap-1]|uniref:HNS binding protein n=1 Tax=Enterobacter phage phiEap-1 TaxID=1587520 RepID=A0A0K2FH37_9CAUD|nr:Gp5.5-like host HNS inhibition [Enterobacter phage phiEap-1]ALA45083.1 hypothetical protein RU59_00020 [Enterobacter phage phiEap-1]
MAMTKRVRVSFDAKLVLSTKDVEAITKNLVDTSKGFLEGKQTDGRKLAGIEAAATKGPEAAIELAIKGLITSNLKELLQEMDFSSFGNFRVEIKQ